MIQPDADDSAKVILNLNLLGVDVGANALEKDHFCSYSGERDASFSANCNILKTLLRVSEVSCHKEDMAKILEYLCQSNQPGNVRLTVTEHLIPVFNDATRRGLGARSRTLGSRSAQRDTTSPSGKSNRRHISPDSQSYFGLSNL